MAYPEGMHPLEEVGESLQVFALYQVSPSQKKTSLQKSNLRGSLQKVAKACPTAAAVHRTIAVS